MADADDDDTFDDLAIVLHYVTPLDFDAGATHEQRRS
jgi:hypothetical protein